MKSQWIQKRGKTAAQLADARLELGHIEDHTRQLQEELAELQAAAAELEELKSDDELKREDLQTELSSVRAAISETGGKLVEARQSGPILLDFILLYITVPQRNVNRT